MAAKVPPISLSLPTMLTPDEFCAMAKIRKQTAAKWRCQRTRGPRFFREGRVIRYRTVDVIAWLENHMVDPG